MIDIIIKICYYILYFIFDNNPNDYFELNKEGDSLVDSNLNNDYENESNDYKKK